MEIRYHAKGGIIGNEPYTNLYNLAKFSNKIINEHGNHIIEFMWEEDGERLLLFVYGLYDVLHSCLYLSNGISRESCYSYILNGKIIKIAPLSQQEAVAYMDEYSELKESGNIDSLIDKLTDRVKNIYDVIRNVCINTQPMICVKSARTSS